MAIKLYYFDFPGRAEPVRLIFHYGGVEFEDVRFPREQWPELKPKTPFGQVPAMELDGTWIAQTHALARFAAAKAGLLPEDPVKAALAEQAIFQVDDAFMLFMPTYKLPDEEKVAARQELLKGAVKDKLTSLAKLLEGKKFILGDDLSHADLFVFTSFALMRAGWLDGVPADFLDEYTALKEHFMAVGSLEKVKSYYAGKTGLYAAFDV